jgi:hypothetical protein
MDLVLVLIGLQLFFKQELLVIISILAMSYTNGISINPPNPYPLSPIPL